MAKNDIKPTREISALYFVKHPFRSDLNFFSYDLEEMRKEINKATNYQPEVYEVQFWLKKPIFKKYRASQLKKLNIR